MLTPVIMPPWAPLAGLVAVACRLIVVVAPPEITMTWDAPFRLNVCPPMVTFAPGGSFCPLIITVPPSPAGRDHEYVCPPIVMVPESDAPWFPPPWGLLSSEAVASLTITAPPPVAYTSVTGAFAWPLSGVVIPITAAMMSATLGDVLVGAG